MSHAHPRHRWQAALMGQAALMAAVPVAAAAVIAGLRPARQPRGDEK